MREKEEEAACTSIMYTVPALTRVGSVPRPRTTRRLVSPQNHRRCSTHSPILQTNKMARILKKSGYGLKIGFLKFWKPNAINENRNRKKANQAKQDKLLKAEKAKHEKLLKEKRTEKAAEKIANDKAAKEAVKSAAQKVSAEAKTVALPKSKLPNLNSQSKLSMI